MDKLKVISLFSGIGAQERGLEELGIDYELLNYCEIDDGKAKAYALLHNESIEKRWKDVTTVNKEDIKPCDLVIYSPPCQAFSVAGKKKGLADIRGTLFWNSLDIIKVANPKYAIMENVDHLPNKFTDEFNEMLKCLDGLGYNNYWQIINAKDFLPQNRNRVYIVSIRKDIDDGNFAFPIGDDHTNWWDFINPIDTRQITGRQQRMINFAQGKATDDSIKIEGRISFDNSIILLRQSGLRFYNNREHPTLCAAMGKGGGNFTILTHEGNYGGIKPRGCFKLMGFKEEDSDMLEQNGFSVSSLYVMAGDSVVVPVIREIERNLLKEYIK
jgi:DNA (cytosine-5)-methyltransferase 1